MSTTVGRVERKPLDPKGKECSEGIWIRKGRSARVGQVEWKHVRFNCSSLAVRALVSFVSLVPLLSTANAECVRTGRQPARRKKE
jgi:hypothetical protein